MRWFGLVSGMTAVMLAACAAGPETCSGGHCADDGMVGQSVLDRLNAHAALKADVLGVQVLDHVAYVRGLVDSEFERQEVEVVARGTPGVVLVVNMTAVHNSRD